RIAVEDERDIAAIATDKADRDRNVQRLLLRLTWRRRRVLRELERVRLRASVVLAARAHHRCARLGVPAAELLEVVNVGARRCRAAATPRTSWFVSGERVFHRLHEILAG